MSRKTARNMARKASRRRSRGSDGQRTSRTALGFCGLALGSIGLSLGGAARAQDAAQPASSKLPQPTTNASSLQEIVVTGIRGSLERSLEIKRMSMGVVDAISAESIGHFPDSSLGQALQRIPGVTVNRFAVSDGSGSAVSIGDASGITVRGFGPTFNETLIDGRPMASAVGRNFDYSSVGADFVEELAILKTPDFSLSSGDIGATVNLKFPKPFDHPGMQARAFASTTDYQADGQFTPAFGALWSDTFADGKFGILLDGDYTDRKDDENHVDVVGWGGTYLNSCQMAGGPVCTDAQGNPVPYNSLTQNFSASTTPKNGFPSWFMQQYTLYNDRTDDRRKDGRAVFQWHPTDAVLITLDDDYSDDRMLTQRAGYAAWFNSGEMFNVTQDGNGTITDFTYGPAPTDFHAIYNGTYIKNNEFGLNVLWEVNDDWSAELDADQSASHLNPGGQMGDYDVDVGYGPSTAAGGQTNAHTGGIVQPGGNNLPYPTAYGPNNDAAGFLGSNIMGSHVLPWSRPWAADHIDQAKLDATWHGGSTRINFGMQFIGDTRNAYSADTFYNNAWQLFSGYGPASGNGTWMCGGTACGNQSSPPAGAVLDTTGHGQALPASLFTGSISTANFIPGWGNNGKLPAALPSFNPYAVVAYLESLGPSAANPGTISNGPAYTGTSIPLALNPSSVSFVQEKTYAPFVTAKHEFHLGAMPLNAQVGLRYERTDVTTGGIGQLPTALTVESSDHTAFLFTYTQPQFLTSTNSYHYVLPSLDLNLLVRPDLKLRLDASRTLSRPPLNEITPTLTVGGRVNALTASGNNPGLLPYLSDNFDLGAEWYYARNDYVAVDGFFKHVSQFPVNETVVTTINGVVDPTTGQPAQWAKTTYLNGPSADVDGVEVTWQQMLPLGFGYMVNGTYVHTNKPYDRYALTNQFALPGISNSVNLVGFYQRNGFQARVAVNWQGEQLVGFGQEQNVSSFGTEPTFLEPATEVDFSTSYDIDAHLSVFFEALNLTDAVQATHGRFDNQSLDTIHTGRIFTMGVRARF